MVRIEKRGGCSGRWLTAQVILAVAALAGGCWSGRPARVVPPAMDPQTVVDAVMQKADANGDGRIAGDEFDALPAVGFAREAFDRDDDKAISREELLTWLEEVKASRVAITSFATEIKHKGRPLSGAMVRLIPEEVMGGTMQQAEGTTDENGMAMVSIPGGEYPGVNCGLYRVEVSGTGNDGKPLPAVYNSQSRLGVSVGGGAIEHGMIVFDLD